MPIKMFDFAVIIPALGVVAASFFFAYSGRGAQYTINLKGSGGEWVFPSDAVETVSVAGPLGDTVVEMRGGAARVVSSPCANQTCVAAGSVHLSGQWAACLPNGVMVYIGGGAGSPRSAEEAATDVDAGAW